MSSPRFTNLTISSYLNDLFHNVSIVQVSRNILPRREAFEVLYHLNCDNLCSDFQEDLSFKFSLGLTCLVNRFMAAGNAKKRPVEVNLLIEILTYCRYVSGLPAGSAQAHVQLLVPRDPEQRVRDPE